MTFIIYGLNGRHDLMPLDRLFERRIVEKTQAATAAHAVDPKQDHDARDRRPPAVAEHAYRMVDRIKQEGRALFAAQIMTSPVVTMTPDAAIAEALQLFQARRLRHVPVVSSGGMLVGMVSDRDILRHMAGVTENLQPQSLHETTGKVMQLMSPHVLTASADTDVRYIARLFVEQRVGAMPIVTDGEVVGIITRSDILRAVMRHFALELWI